MRFFSSFSGGGGNSGMPIYLSSSHLSFHFGRYANAGGGGKGQAVYLIPAPPPLLWRRRQGPYGIPRTTNNIPGMRCQLAPPGVISMLGQGEKSRRASSSFPSSSCRVKRQVFYSCCIHLAAQEMIGDHGGMRAPSSRYYFLAQGWVHMGNTQQRKKN